MKKNNLPSTLYEKYQKLDNERIEVTLKTREIIVGVIVGFSFQNLACKNRVIARWHIVNEKEKESRGFDEFGFLLGRILCHEEISQVYFFEDNTTLHFD